MKLKIPLGFMAFSQPVQLRGEGAAWYFCADEAIDIDQRLRQHPRPNWIVT